MKKRSVIITAIGIVLVLIIIVIVINFNSIYYGGSTKKYVLKDEYPALKNNAYLDNMLVEYFNKERIEQISMGRLRMEYVDREEVITCTTNNQPVKLSQSTSRYSKDDKINYVVVVIACEGIYWISESVNEGILKESLYGPF